LKPQNHDPDRKLREDLRDLRVYTIDAATASEIDDAIALWMDEQSRPWIIVCVADPARLLQPFSVLERYASRRGASVFLPERHFPVIPQSLSSSIFSINPGKETHTLSFSARVCPETGAVLEGRVFSSIVRNVTKMSYNR
jgi:exoribonuclease R